MAPMVSIHAERGLTKKKSTPPLTCAIVHEGAPPQLHGLQGQQAQPGGGVLAGAKCNPGLQHDVDDAGALGLGLTPFRD